VAREADAGYSITVTAQKPLRHSFVGSQQSLTVVHLSPTAEQLFVGGVLAHTRPPLPDDSQ
jgi:hypothetical protein